MSSYRKKVIILNRSQVVSTKTAIKDFIANYEQVELSVPNIMQINHYLNQVLVKLDERDEELEI